MKWRYTFYNAAVMTREQEHMPLTGLTKDRQMLQLVTMVANSNTIRSLMCFCCDQIYTDIKSLRTHGVFPSNKKYWTTNEIQLHKVEKLLDYCKRDEIGFKTSFSLIQFRDWYGDAFADSDALGDGPGDSRCRIQGNAGEFTGWVSCNPEDVVRCNKCKNAADKRICTDCEIPLCAQCARYILPSGPTGGIPWSLANDNFWDSTCPLVYKYNVTWLEMAIASPCWTTMLICYVEGDRGHLMNEVVGQQQWRTRIKGSVASFQMPWEDILQDLNRNVDDATLAEIPRTAASVKYLLRVHLKVGTVDFTKKLRELRVRPFVVLLLLHWLIERNHPVFKGKGTALELKQRVKLAVEREYPETEATLPEDERAGHIPEAIATMVEEARAAQMEVNTDDAASAPRVKRLKITSVNDEKNATPGPGGRKPEDCLKDANPVYLGMDRSAQSVSDPATQREKAVGAYDMGDINVHTGAQFVDTWHPSYASKVFPFSVTRAVSGPDFRPDQGRGRRHADESPILLPKKFMKMMARRSPACIQSDWTVVPAVRASTWKWECEHIFALAAPHIQPGEGAADTSCHQYIEAAKKLAWHLQSGVVGQGPHRIPIKGDTTLLPRAKGLTNLERRLAMSMSWIAKHLPGTQQLRQLMGHRQFGARVVYGDCIFLTMSPDPQKSALVLKLSRYRANDPYVKHGDELTKRLAQRDYPPLEANTTRPETSSEQATSAPDGQEDDSAEIEIPDYLLRLRTTARQPLAVVDAYRVQVKLLADLLGVRMCPDCPRCNNHLHGCQDMFGCNMRPLGGIFGGMSALGGATEHQAQGAPHLHMEGHVVCVYQYGTLKEVADKIRAKLLEKEDVMKYNNHMYRSETLDDASYEAFRPHVEAAFDNRFADRSHNGMCATPSYLAQDAACSHANCPNCEAKPKVKTYGKRKLEELEKWPHGGTT